MHGEPKDNHAEDTPHRGPVAIHDQNPLTEKRTKWTREEYKQVNEVFFKATNDPSETATTKAAYKIWRQKILGLDLI